MPYFSHHIFVCTNTRPSGHPRGSCNPDGSGSLRERFVEGVKRRGLKATVRANAAGCLDQCEHGPTVVVYPEGIWYGKVQASDVDEILDAHVVGGIPVARLRLDASCVNVARCPHKPGPGGSPAIGSSPAIPKAGDV